MSLSLVGAARPQNAFTIAVTSGKDGVGKTSVSINLAVALARLHRRVALLDADVLSETEWTRLSAAVPGLQTGVVAVPEGARCA